MATKKAITQLLLFCNFFATLWVVNDVHDNEVEVSTQKSETTWSISTILNLDGVLAKWSSLEDLYKTQLNNLGTYPNLPNIQIISLYCFWRFFLFPVLMADNIRRAMQDISLGSEVEPFVLPTEVVR